MRKRETDRIERENHAFAKRLFDKQANFTKKSMDTDFKSHLVYKKQIAKMTTPGRSSKGVRGGTIRAGMMTGGNSQQVLTQKEPLDIQTQPDAIAIQQ